MSARRRDVEAPEPSGDSAPLAWLETLEARVHDAADRLAATSAENARLRERVEALEAKLAARAEGVGGDAEGTGRGAWRREREEVRERVRRLAESLEALLAESAASVGSGEGGARVESDEAEER